MPITYGMVAGRDHGCDRQPLTDKQKSERDSFRRMHRYICVNIDDLLGLPKPKSEKRKEYNAKKKELMLG